MDPSERPTAEEVFVMCTDERCGYDEKQCCLVRQCQFVDGVLPAAVIQAAAAVAPAAARKEMTSRCQFCSLKEFAISRLVITEMSLSSQVSCPICSAKAQIIGACDACNRGFDNVGLRCGEGRFPNLKCRSCQ